MKYLEHAKELKKIAGNLRYLSSFRKTSGFSIFLANYIQEFREIIEELEKLDLPDNIQYYISRIHQTNIFTRFEPLILTGGDQTILSNNTNNIEIALETIVSNNKKILEQASEDTIFVRLPDINSLEELSKVSNDLKKCIELPIHDLRGEEKVEIVAVHPGSIWLTITLGSLAAVGLIGRICTAAASIRKEWAAAKMFEEKARTMELNNDILSALSVAVKVDLANKMNAEALAIQAGYYNHNDPEALKRTTLSISIFSELMDKNLRIETASSDGKVTNSFPDFNTLNQIDAALKKLTGKND
jgi:hypothetical protein